ncbi:hypothetical protein GCM10009665_28370 [Kitasatospora nipponensis]|uniref:Uncharacterized protein n=1 Tax=Kitasatospora nipponensis TaxID=258049 RepID=A0ABP4GSM7_9ACTN
MRGIALGRSTTGRGPVHVGGVCLGARRLAARPGRPVPPHRDVRGSAVRTPTPGTAGRAPSAKNGARTGRASAPVPPAPTGVPATPGPPTLAYPDTDKESLCQFPE